MAYTYAVSEGMDPAVEWPVEGGLYDRENDGDLTQVIGPPLPPEPVE